MKMIKVEEGLLEHYNYFLHMPISDILGSNLSHRTDDTFYLSNGIAERPFNYDEFVIVVKKDNLRLGEEDKISLFVRSNGRVYGLTEEGSSKLPQSQEWKIVSYNNYIQSYMKDKGEWLNLGGTTIKTEMTHQGFKVDGETPRIS